jgi:hypothetical protein
MANRKPKIGDYIVHHEPHFDRSTEGTITQLLSAQFVYVSQSGDTRMCMFNENWTFKDNK